MSEPGGSNIQPKADPQQEEKEDVSCLAGLDCGTLKHTQLETVDDDIAISNTLTFLLSMLDKLLRFDQRQKETTALQVNRKQTVLLDALALSLTQRDEVTAVLATPRGTETDFIAIETLESYVTTQNVAPKSNTKSFSLLKAEPSHIHDYEPLLRHVSTRITVPFAKHAATLASLLSTPPDNELFSHMKINYFVTAGCVRKILKKFEHRTGVALLQWMKDTLTEVWPEDASSPKEDCFKPPNQNQLKRLPDEQATPQQEGQLKLLEEKVKVDKVIDIEKYSVKELNLIALFPKRLFQSTKRFPFLYQATLTYSLIKYRQSLEDLEKTINKVRSKPGSLAGTVFEFGKHLAKATTCGSRLIDISRPGFFELHLSCFQNPVNLFNRVVKKSEGLHDPKSTTSTVVEGSSSPNRVGDELEEEDEEEGQEEDEEALDFSKPLSSQVVELIRQMSSKHKASSILQRHAGESLVTINAISAPSPSAEWRPLADVLDIAFHLQNEAKQQSYAETFHKDKGTGGRTFSKKEIIAAKVDKAITTLEASVKRLEGRGSVVNDLAMLKKHTVPCFPGRLHCECLLALLRLQPDHIQGKRIRESLKLAKSYIGVSKRCCASCAKCLELIGGLTVGGVQETWFPWSMPRWLSARVRKDLITYFGCVLDKRLDALDASLRRSISSDHSAASQALDEDSLPDNRDFIAEADEAFERAV